ncbi:glycosyltransferase family protein [Polynucleobacter sp.]|uniref:glycosyltransferase family protein n=1 Tax=Polynucleobacter sp. TaxID=2029855 RepID=UPI003F69721B
MLIAFLGNFQVDFSSETHHSKTLQSMGHTVFELQEGQVTSDEVLRVALKCDMFIWIHTHGWHTTGTDTMRHVLMVLKRQGIPSVTYHLDLWLGIDRARDMSEDYWTIANFFTVDKQMAEWLNENTQTKGHYLQAGVYDKECYLTEPKPIAPFDVAFVGSRTYHPEWQYRPQLVDWLRATYGKRFAHFGNDGAGVVRGHDLNRLYADTPVIIGDTLCKGFDYPYYYSDRVFETTGRGGFIIHPYIKGLEDCFDLKTELITYEFGNWDQLKGLIDHYVANPEERNKIRLAGHERTKRDHTYRNRWQSIIEKIVVE